MPLRRMDPLRTHDAMNRRTLSLTLLFFAALLASLVAAGVYDLTHPQVSPEIDPRVVPISFEAPAATFTQERYAAR